MRIESQHRMNKGNSLPSRNAYSSAFQHNSSKNLNFTSYKLIESFADPAYKHATNYLYEFSNKMKALLIEKKTPGISYMGSMSSTAVINEPEAVRGIRHALEHTSFLVPLKAKNDHFSMVTEKLGGDANAYTSYDGVGFVFGVSGNKKESFGKILGPYSKVIISPKFPNKQVEGEKNIIIEEIKTFADDPENSLRELVIKNLYGLETKADDVILGTEQNVSSITRNDLVNYHKNNFASSMTQLVVVSDFPHEELIKILDKHFCVPEFQPSDVEPFVSKLSPLQTKKVQFIPSKLVQSFAVNIGLLGPTNTDAKGVLASQLIMKILTEGKYSRLGKKLSELNTAADSELIKFSNGKDDSKMLFFEFNSEPKTVQKSLDYFKEVIEGLKTNPISQEELFIAQKGIKKEFITEAEMSETHVELLSGFSLNDGIDGYKNFLSNVDNITLKELNSAVGKYFTLDKASVGILHPEKSKVKNITFTGQNVMVAENIKKIILLNNIKLAITNAEDKLLTSSILSIQSKTKAKVGVLDILSRMLSNSSALRSESEMARFKAFNGLNDFEIQPANYGLTFSANAMPEDTLAAIYLIKETLTEPSLSYKNFNKAKKEVILECQSELRSAEERAYELLYPGKNEGVSNRLLNEKLPDVKLEDVRNYYNAFMKSASALVSVSGPLSSVEGLEKDIAKSVGAISHKFSANDKLVPKFELPTVNKVVVQAEDDREMSEILQVFHINNPTMKEVAALNVLNSILGAGFTSRLFTDLRDTRNLAYNVESNFEFFGRFAREELRIETGIFDKNKNLTDNITKSLVGFGEHLNKLLTTKPTKAEMQKAKEMIFNDYARQVEPAHSFNAQVASMVKANSDEPILNLILDEVEKVTSNDVQEVAQKYLTQPSVTSILTTEDALKQAESFLKTKGEYKFYADDN